MYTLLIPFLTLTLCGCIDLSTFFSTSQKQSEPPLLTLSYKAGDHLHSQLSETGVAGYPMLAASFVDSARVEKTNDLGRLLSEQVASRLSQYGYSVSEVQLRSDQLRVEPDGGVFALSRDVAEINADVEAYSILVGTYTLIGRQIYVNARVLRTSDGVALASSDFSLPMIRDANVVAGGHLPTVHGGGAEPSVRTRLQ